MCENDIAESYKLDDLKYEVRKARPKLLENTFLVELAFSRQLDSNRAIIQDMIGKYRTAIWMYNQGTHGPVYSTAKRIENKLRAFLYEGDSLEGFKA